MHEINITELRSHLPKYLGRVKKGEQILVTSRGKVVASLVPVQDVRTSARKRLAELRDRCMVGDVVSPTGEEWVAENAGD